MLPPNNNKSTTRNDDGMPGTYRFGFVANVDNLFEVLVLALHFAAELLESGVVEIATLSGPADVDVGQQAGRHQQQQHIVTHLDRLVSNLSTGSIPSFHSAGA